MCLPASMPWRTALGHCGRRRAPEPSRESRTCTTSPAAYTSGRLVWQIGPAHQAASLRRAGGDGERRVGAHSDRLDDEVAGLDAPIGEHGGRRRAVLHDDALRRDARPALDAVRGEVVLQKPRRLGVEHRRQDARRQLEHEHLVDQVGEGLGSFQPDEPRSDDEGAALPACGTCRLARVLRELLRFEGVVEGEERRRVGGLVEPVDGRRERDAPRRDQAASVSDAFAVRERDAMPLRVDRNRFIALSEEGRDAHPVVEGGILVPDPVERGLALQQVRYQRAAVHRMRLGARNGYRLPADGRRGSPRRRSRLRRSCPR